MIRFSDDSSIFLCCSNLYTARAVCFVFYVKHVFESRRGVMKFCWELEMFCLQSPGTDAEEGLLLATFHQRKWKKTRADALTMTAGGESMSCSSCWRKEWVCSLHRDDPIPLCSWKSWVKEKLYMSLGLAAQSPQRNSALLPSLLSSNIPSS